MLLSLVAGQPDVGVRRPIFCSAVYVIEQKYEQQQQQQQKSNVHPVWHKKIIIAFTND